MKLPKYSMGVGDRFAHQGVAQLDAMIMARDKGVSIAQSGTSPTANTA